MTSVLSPYRASGKSDAGALPVLFAAVLALAIERCPKCEASAPHVTMSRHKKKGAKRLARGLLRPDSLRRFARAVEREEERRRSG